MVVAADLLLLVRGPEGLRQPPDRTQAQAVEPALQGELVGRAVLLGKSIHNHFVDDLLARDLIAPDLACVYPEPQFAVNKSFQALQVGIHPYADIAIRSRL